MLTLVASTRLLRAMDSGDRPDPEPAAALEGSARRLIDLGFQRLLLDRELSVPEWETLERFFPQRSLAAAFLFVPLRRTASSSPPPLPGLASVDADERREAVKLGRQSLEFADRHQIPLVLLPPAALDEPSPGSIRRALEKSLATGKRAAPSGAADRLWSQVWEKRRTSAGFARQLDGWKTLVYSLLEMADRLGLRLGLVPGGWPRELPQEGELDPILAELRGAPLAIIGDTANHERSLLSRSQGSEDFPSRCHDRLEGVLVHDAAGFVSHLPPGAGDVRFELWRDERWKEGKDLPLFLDFETGAANDNLPAWFEKVRSAFLPAVQAAPRRSILDPL